MDYLASMYIDNEMDLGEKRQFVEMVHHDDEFYSLTVGLLNQEQRLRQMPAMLPVPAAEKRWRPPVRSVLTRLAGSFGLAAAGFAAAVLMVNTVSWNPPVSAQSNRFVLFEPVAERVELTGSFTGWQRVAMQRIGDSGYWQLNLPVPAGEHRFAYILNGERRMADPTLPAVERDDFGGENSILNVEVHI
jgi:hypothetical protein